MGGGATNEATRTSGWEPTARQLIGFVVFIGAIAVVLLVFVSVDVAGLFVSGLTPLVVVVFGYVLNQRVREFQLERERHRNRIERRHKLRIELTLDANFYGPEGESYLSEFLIYVHNKSHVKHEFSTISLRVLGFKEGEEPTEWEKRPPRMEFPHGIIETNALPDLPDDPTPYFVEPGVKQPVTFVTSVGKEFAYVLVRAQFYYGETGEKQFGPHSVERLFPVEPGESG